MRRSNCFVALLALLHCSSVLSTTIHVSTTGSDSSSCGAVASPCLTIKQAVDLGYNTAATATVQLSAGTYSPQSNSDVTSAGIELYGSTAIVVAGDSTTVIDCGGNGRAFVITAEEDLVTLQGLTINNCQSIETDNTVAVEERTRGVEQGNAMSTSDMQQWGGFGGAILILDRAAPRISDITISNCYASTDGGGIRSEKAESFLVSYRNGETGEDPVFRNVAFSGNVAKNGGGISLYMSRANVTSCTFTGNRATGDGGGLNLEYYSEPAISNTNWTNNSATGCGGAVMIQSYLTQPSFLSNWFEQNNATDGGAICIANGASPFFESTTVQLNSAIEKGGGLYMGSTGIDQVRSLCGDSDGLIVRSNSATFGGGLYFDLGDSDGEKVAVKPVESTQCDLVCGSNSTDYFGNTATHGGAAKTSDPTGIFVITQPENSTSPISTTVEDDRKISLAAVFALVDMFQAYTTSANGSELELILYPSLCTDDSVTCVQVSSSCLVDSDGTVTLGGESDCSMHVSQAVSNKSYWVVASGLNDLDYLIENKTSEIEISDCDSSLDYIPCTCDDSDCGCWLTSRTQHTCILKSDSNDDRLWILIIGAVTGGLCCLAAAGLLAYRKYTYERDWNPHTTMFSNPQNTDSSTLAFESFGYGVLDYNRHLRIEKQIGTGNFGSVFLAVTCRRDTMPARYVAVKELHFKAEEAAEELVREALLMKEIPYHCCVVRLLGVTIAPPCLVTELVEGAKEVDQYLQDVLREQLEAVDHEGTALTAPQSTTYANIALTVMRDAASGLQHLHAHDIIHRDVAARNVLVNSSGRALVSDFGLSRNFGHGNTVSASGSGQQTGSYKLHTVPDNVDGDAVSYHEFDGAKPYYGAAPENYGVSKEAKGRDIHTKKSDVFMYGTMLWEALSGKWGQLTETGRFKRGYLIYFTEASGLPPDADVNIETLPARHGEDAKRGLFVMSRKLTRKYTVPQEQVDRLVELMIKCLQKEQAARCDFTHVCSVLDELVKEEIVDEVDTPAPSMHVMTLEV